MRVGVHRPGGVNMDTLHSPAVSLCLLHYRKTANRAIGLLSHTAAAFYIQLLFTHTHTHTQQAGFLILNRILPGHGQNL